MKFHLLICFFLAEREATNASADSQLCIQTACLFAQVDVCLGITLIDELEERFDNMQVSTRLSFARIVAEALRRCCNEQLRLVCENTLLKLYMLDQNQPEIHDACRVTFSQPPPKLNSVLDNSPSDLVSALRSRGHKVTFQREATGTWTKQVVSELQNWLKFINSSLEETNVRRQTRNLEIISNDC